MRKLLYIILIGLLISICGCSSIEEVPQENQKITSIADDINNIKEDDLNNTDVNQIQTETLKTDTHEVFQINVDETLIMNTIETLCQSPRKWGSPEEKKAYNFLNSQLMQYGYITYIQKFPVYENQKNYSYKFEDFFNLNPLNNLEPLGYGHNLIAIKKTNKNKKKTLVLSAHYDTNTGSIGAIDNASGTSVLLEIARQLQNFPTSFNIKFIFFSAEEHHYGGSKYYVSQLTDEEKSNILACINIDMVGEKDAGELVMCTPQGIPTVINFVVDEILKGKSFNSKLQGGSDHLPFTIANIPAITFDQPNRDIRINHKENQMDYLDSKELKHTAEVITEIVTKYDLNLHEEFVTNKKEKIVKEDSINVSVSDIKINKANLPGFTLKNIKSKLYNTGVSSTITYTFENSEGQKYYISQTPILFTPDVDLLHYTLLEYDDNSRITYYVSSDEASSTKLLVEGFMYLTEFKGDLSREQAMEIYKN